MSLSVLEKCSKKLGPYEVSAIGLGCMALSGFPPEKTWILSQPEQAIGVIHAALDAGVTLLDTADIYSPTWNSMGHNERVIGEAVRTWRGPINVKNKIVIATKGGITRSPDNTWFGISGRNADEHYLYRAVEASALRLGVSKIKLWQLHRLDPKMSFETQIENVLKLKAHGIVENVGLSNVTPDQLRRAIKIGGTPSEGGLISIQNEWSPRYRHGGEVLKICEENAVAFLPWSPLGGIGNPAAVGSGKYRSFNDMAQTKQISPCALTIAWHLATSPITIPIPGATHPESILDSCKGVGVDLNQNEVASLNASLPTDLGPIHEEMLSHPPFRD